MRTLKVFLCHSSRDKAAVRALYRRLKSLPAIEPWLDEENLLAGQDWQLEITKAVESSDAVIVCLSSYAVSTAGYVHREILHALEVALEQPEDTIFIVPIRLEVCDVPSRLKRLHWVDLFEEHGFDQLSKSLSRRLQSIIKSDEQTSQGAALPQRSPGDPGYQNTPAADQPRVPGLGRRNLEERVKTIIIEQLGVDESEITLQASFTDDLGADSLDIVELVMAFEEEFDLEVPDGDAEKITTVGILIDYLKALGI